MNTLTMNTNLQSQQFRRRQQQSGQKNISEESRKSEDANASENDMLMHRKENHNIHVSIYVDPKSSSNRFSSKNPIMMRDPDKTADAAGKETTTIVTPHPNDVLCGRGGSINSHAGNVVFREWIQERRESYNLAETKSDKTRVTNEIFQRVRSLRPPGRFLHKVEAPVTNDDTNDDVDWWAEVDNAKALAKISQALREGAPAFRAAHGKPSSQRTPKRRNSVPAPKIKTESKQKLLLRSPKRCKTESPPFRAHLRSSVLGDMDISPPYYSEGAAVTDLDLDVDNLDSLFSHNQIQSYMNTPYSNAAYHSETELEDYTRTHNADNNRFDQLRPLNSHPLVNMGDYHASISDVANAIPPTPQPRKQRVASFDTSELLSSPVRAPPYSMQYEQFDPYSFLSPIPSGRNWSVINSTNSSNNIRDQRTGASKLSSMIREHSLSFTESELREDVGEFTNPFDEEELLNQALQQNLKDDGAPINSTKQTTAKMFESPYSTSDDSFTSPHVTPPARGLSFGGIGTIPTGHFLGSRKSSVTSSGEGDKVVNSKQQNGRNETTQSNSKQDGVAACKQCRI